MNALSAFEAAARFQGFTAAARATSANPGAISRYVAILEEYYGVELFKRHHSDIHLTRAGERYYTRIRSALDVIENAGQNLAESSNSHQVHVNALPTFAMHWLIPRLPNFRALFPRVAIHLSGYIEQIEDINLEPDGFDIALHYSLSATPGENCDFLFESELEAVCHPRIAAGIREPGDVLQQTLLANVNGLTHWRDWFDSAGVDLPLPTLSMKFGDTSLILQAAVDGMGVALGESFLVRDDVNAGRLASPLAHRFQPRAGYFMMVNPTRAQTPSIQAFREWLLSEIRDFNMLLARTG